MGRHKRPYLGKRCYGCSERHYRTTKRFCSDTCAADWAELLARGNEDEWCPNCDAWVYECVHALTITDVLEDYLSEVYLLLWKDGEHIHSEILPSSHYVGGSHGSFTTDFGVNFGTARAAEIYFTREYDEIICFEMEEERDAYMETHNLRW